METIRKVRAAVDKANGYIYGTDEERSLINLLSTAVGAQFQSDVAGTVTEGLLGDDDVDEDEMYE